MNYFLSWNNLLSIDLIQFFFFLKTGSIWIYLPRPCGEYIPAGHTCNNWRLPKLLPKYDSSEWSKWLLQDIAAATIPGKQFLF